jgi:hypothetical protein
MKTWRTRSGRRSSRKGRLQFVAGTVVSLMFRGEEPPVEIVQNPALSFVRNDGILRRADAPPRLPWLVIDVEIARGVPEENSPVAMAARSPAEDGSVRAYSVVASQRRSVSS